MSLLRSDLVAGWPGGRAAGGATGALTWVRCGRWARTARARGAHCAVVKVDLGRHRDDAMQRGFVERRASVNVALASGRLHRGGRREGEA